MLSGQSPKSTKSTDLRLRQRPLSQLSANSIEFVVASEVDHDFAFAFSGLADLNFGAERCLEFLFERGRLSAAAAAARLVGGV